jgi:hypothetical protein
MLARILQINSVLQLCETNVTSTVNSIDFRCQVHAKRNFHGAEKIF